ncbi:hypothetical protein KDW_45510 [Dictyobacter vulcani]|uniref:Uncharacterized protein n=1 Tax=Dictyobacter vulcani TaxID=2607529 RepID=A0A5J4KW85_9CHLR|nr:hypothetical protein KDW_45510 [Dictyobacter vulcani]
MIFFGDTLSVEFAAGSDETTFACIGAANAVPIKVKNNPMLTTDMHISRSCEECKRIIAL